MENNVTDLPLLKIEPSAQQKAVGSFAAVERIIDIRQITQTQDKMVTISPVAQRDKHKEPRATFTSFTDEEGIVWGIPLKINEKNGRVVFKRLTIDGSFTFNLNRIEEAMMFEIWKRSPFVKGGLEAGHTSPIFYVMDPEAEADREIQKAKIKNFNESFILDASAEDINNLAIVVIGQAALKNKVSINRNELLKYNNEKPIQLKKHIDSTANTEVVALFEKAFAYGLISLDATRGYVTDRGGFLGLDKMQAIGRFRSSIELYRTYEERIKQMESQDKKPVATQNLAPTPEARLQQDIRNAQDPESLMIHPALGGKDTTIPPPLEVVDQGVDIMNAGASPTYMPIGAPGEKDVFAEEEDQLNDLLKAVEPKKVEKPAASKKQAKAKDDDKKAES